MNRLEYDVLVIGGGAAGIGAALTASKAGAKTALVEKDRRLGGILNQCIHSGFGLSLYREELTGPEMALRMQEEGGYDVYLSTFVLSVSKSLEARCLDRARGEFVIKAKAVVLATGSSERTAGQIGLVGDRPGGIYPAGEAQRLVNINGHLPGKEVFILGSGDVGLILARRLSLEGAHVIAVAERNSYSCGLERNKAQCLDDFNIPLLLSTTVTRVIGKDRVEEVETVKVDGSGRPVPGTAKAYKCDCLILSVGLIPNFALLKTLGVKASRSKGPSVDDSLMSEIDGIFCAGNGLHVHDLADMAYSEGCFAGGRAAEYAEGDFRKGGRLGISAGENIAYCVPSFLAPGQMDTHKVLFRAKRPISSATLEITQGGKTIKKLFKQKCLPSEMQEITITNKLLENNLDDLTISLREGR